MPALIPCTCPAKPGGERPHETDTITFRPALTPREAFAISRDIAIEQMGGPISGGDVLAILSEQYVLRGVESWTCVDADGKPLTVTKATIRERLLSDIRTMSIVADEADDLYSEAVTLPLVLMASSSSQPSPTEESTSATTDSGSTPRTPSTLTSITTIPTADIETTPESHDGGSSTSRKSRSVAS